MKVLLVVIPLVTIILAAFHIDFTVLTDKLKDLDGNITRILKSRNYTKDDPQDLVFKLQSYVYNLGPLTRIMPIDKEVHKFAKKVYDEGPPNFLAVPVDYDHIQLSFRWTETQMKVLHYIYDNAEKHWQDFLEEYKKLNISNI